MAMLSSSSSSKLTSLQKHELSSSLSNPHLTVKPTKLFFPSSLHHKKLSTLKSHSTPFASPVSSSVGGQPSRVYVGYSIYKRKSALTVSPIPPEFTPASSGAYKISREGFVLLQFAPAVENRVYDWGRKQVFSLSVTEIGTLISLAARESCEFFHDPNKGKGGSEGKISKVLKVEPLPDGSGHFFNLSVQNKLIDTDVNIYIPVTRAEFAVLTSAFNFILPHLIGWHAFTNTIRLDDTSRLNGSTTRYGRDYEWSR